MPDDHDGIMSIPPCDNSDASKITAKDKSRSSVRHNSIQFNDNLRRHMGTFIPTFNDTYTNATSINYSWCWNSKACPSTIETLKVPSEQLYTYFSTRIAGQIDHSLLLLANEDGTYPLPNDINNRTGFNMCKYEMTVTVTRRVTKLWDEESSEHYLMTRRENTIFYHENSVEIPKEEPFLCSNTQACDDFQDVKLRLCLKNVSIIDKDVECRDKFAKDRASYKCKETKSNPDYGYTSFDNFYMAFLTSFRLVALDAWNRLYYLTLHTSGKGYVLFYIFLVFLGSYYLINLILAVVYMAYEEEVAAVEEELQQMEAEEAERKIRQNNERAELKKKEGLNTIPEFKIDQCHSRLHDPADLEHNAVSNQVSNASQYSYTSSTRRSQHRLGYANGGLTQSRYGSHLSIRSQLTLQSKNDIKNDEDQQQQQQQAPQFLNASDWWKILKSKAPQIGK